jgi:hypothetical protein
MPIKPVTGTLHLPVETEPDVYNLFDAGLKIARDSSPSRRHNAARDLEDHFFYVGALCPSYAISLQPAFVRLTEEQLAGFAFTFNTWLYLLNGADDTNVGILVDLLRERPDNWVRRDMLAAIGTPPALSALADLAHRYDWTDDLARMGFDIPDTAEPARPRFTAWRKAVKVLPFTDSRSAWLLQPNPIGLPLSEVTDAAGQQVIRWHYLSIATAALSQMPSLPAERLHLVSTRINCCWTLYCTLLEDGRYSVSSVVNSQEEDEEGQEINALLGEREKEDPDRYAIAQLLPFDDSLTYTNSHILCTEDVYGQVGGPPIGLYPNPRCERCRVLMFHVLTVPSYINDYGDGWRSLYVCENCRMTACTATSWN